MNEKIKVHDRDSQEAKKKKRNRIITSPVRPPVLYTNTATVL